MGELPISKLVRAFNSVCEGNKFDVIHPDFSRDEIVKFLAPQPGEVYHDQFRFGACPEIQKNGRPAARAAGEAVGEYVEITGVVHIADLQPRAAIGCDAFRPHEGLKAIRATGGDLHVLVNPAIVQILFAHELNQKRMAWGMKC